MSYIDNDPADDAFNAANEGRIRIVDTGNNASDLVCVDVDKAYNSLLAVIRKAKWLPWFGLNTTVEIDCINETRQLVKVVMRPVDIRLVFKFPMPSSIVKPAPQPTKLGLIS
jgi:hypothetical protein